MICLYILYEPLVDLYINKISKITVEINKLLHISSFLKSNLFFILFKDRFQHVPETKTKFPAILNLFLSPKVAMFLKAI